MITKGKDVFSVVIKKLFLTKSEIFQELQNMKEEGISIYKTVVIGDASLILNDIEPNITYRTDEEPQNIDIWVEPKYYDYLVKCEGYYEQMGYDHPCIGKRYEYCGMNGAILLHKGTGPKPQSKKIQGYNVQMEESKPKQKSNITNFRVVK